MKKKRKLSSKHPYLYKEFGLGSQLQAWGNQSTNPEVEGALTNKQAAGVAAGVSGVSGLMSGITNAINAAQIKDTTELRNNIQNIGNAQVSAANNQDLLNQWGQLSSIDRVSADDLVNTSLKDAGLGMLNSVGEAAGSAVSGLFGSANGGYLNRKPASNQYFLGGLVSAGIGAAGKLIGGLGNLIGAGIAKGKAEKEAAEVNELATQSEARRQASFVNAANNLAENMSQQAMANYAALGGPLFPNSLFDTGITTINTGKTHEANPNGGVPAGIDPNGIPNTVEEGETIYKDYVFSNRLKLPKDIREKYKLKGDTFSDAFKYAMKEYEERPRDEISENGIDDIFNILKGAQEEVRFKKGIYGQNKRVNMSALGGNRFGEEYNYFFPHTQWNKFLYYPIPSIESINTKSSEQEAPNNKSSYNTPNRELINFKLEPTTLETPPVAPELQAPTVNDFISQKPLTDEQIAKNRKEALLRNYSEESTVPSEKYSKASWMRYLEPLGSLAGVITDAFNLTNTPGNYNYIPDHQEVTPKYIGNYLTYNPFDTRYALNQQQAQNAATRSAIMQSSSPSRNAALLAAQYNANNSIGDIYRKAQEYNFEQKKAIEDFNRGTNMFNSQLAMNADELNNRNRLLTAREKLNQARLNEESSNLAWQGRAANIGNTLESLANIGRESDAKNYRKALINDNVFGPQTVDNLKAAGYSDKQIKNYFKRSGMDDIDLAALGISANGGKIRRKKRKTLTY